MKRENSPGPVLDKELQATEDAESRGNSNLLGVEPPNWLSMPRGQS